jgi:hypothetical protein
VCFDETGEEVDQSVSRDAAPEVLGGIQLHWYKLAAFCE